MFNMNCGNLEESSMCYKATLQIYTSVTAEVQLKTLVNSNSDVTSVEDPKFIKQDQVAIARSGLIQTGRVICIEQLQYFPQFGRFTLHDRDRIVGIEQVLEVIASGKKLI
ncbi:unnamed protein product [Rotaria sordida]|uniref:GTP-eEF1A C-terminal domain-containing protein n=1 Tax=Rotaria sordida TaxID=392033 RepID=A0A816B8E8_9BILA|nr:unnamed protein product [Rotaria sordida]CAF1364052.1 unnamed protein product [Rotaria sordida]CAF1436920.1 unnamed protein product [Rotaria sordida]CAF1523103.1 unnamed protein product [Rotaria sordida]CAF1608068.1 unnamed protein product [Rotaria sordida]